MFCTNCGAPQPESVPPFCAVCGGPWGWLCGCGNTNGPEGKFCAACGNGRTLTQSPRPKTEAEPPNVAGNPAIETARKKSADLPVVDQLSTEEIDQLLIESSKLVSARKQTITQADIDRLFEKK